MKMIVSRQATFQTRMSSREDFVLGDTVAIGINSRKFDCVPEEAEGWTCLCMRKNSVPYT